MIAVLCEIALQMTPLLSAKIESIAHVLIMCKSLLGIGPSS